MNRKILPFFFIILLSILTSCGYSIHKKEHLPFTKISIGKIENKTFEPGLQDKLYRSLTDAFIQYGFEINSTFNHRIEGEITKFEIKTLSEKGLLTTEYQIIIFCSFRLLDTDTGKIFTIDNISEPFMNYFVSTGRLEYVLGIKELAIEESLKELSREIVRLILIQGNLK